MSFSRGLFLAAFLALGLPGLRAAAWDFSDLAGSYKSTFSVNFGGTQIDGSDVKIEIAVPKNGSQAKIRIVGFGAIAANGTVQKIAFLGNLKLTARRKIVADNALLAFYAQLPATGTLAGNLRRARFTLTSTSSGLGTFVVGYTLRFNGRKLLISGTGTSPNGPVAISYTAIRKGR